MIVCKVFFHLFMSSLPTASCVLAGTYSVSLKNRPRSNLKSFLIPNLDLSEKIKNSYQLRPNLALFFNLVALSLG